MEIFNLDRFIFLDEIEYISVMVKVFNPGQIYCSFTIWGEIRDV